jgi:hypothetical protein
MKALSICLLVVGVIWALWVALIYLVMSGISQPISVGYTSLYYTAMLIGPILLIAGSILALGGSHQRLGSMFAIVGCAILTVLVGRETILSFHVEPLQAKPPYVLFAVMILLTVLADIGAFRLYQLVSSAKTQRELVS